MTKEKSSSSPPNCEPTFRERLLAMSSAEQVDQLSKLLQVKVAEVLNKGESEVSVDVPFRRLNEEWKDPRLVHPILNDLIQDNLEFEIFWSRELENVHSIKSLAEHLANELKLSAPETSFTDPYEGGNWSWALPPSCSEEAEQNQGIVFILSSPRAGSTLLRVMLAGHPALFSPPELNLLPFESMAERGRQIDQLGYSWMRRGPVIAFAQLEDLTPEQVEQLERDDVPVRQVYRILQEQAGERLLVDKSPSYACHPAWLRRAEELFEGSKYLHLVRHPYAVIESFVRMRFHWLLGNHWLMWDQNPWLLAEKVWAIANSHILTFLKDIEPPRKHRVLYENLVSNPSDVLSGVCHFLDIPFNEEVLKPYEGNRMVDGIGDPNFLARNKIDASLAIAWQEKCPTQQLSEFTQRVAAELGYNLREED